ncbi:hypothetical protein X760_10840 [Mesorhizobium sp. LSHC422A00]|nr:hypothetical protein X760_10840 [Mesorhizobium sp. LSHC422A00]
MEQLRKDLALLTRPGFWIAFGILLLLYGIQVFFLIRTCQMPLAWNIDTLAS